MSQCVIVNATGQLEIAADPCTSLVLLTPAEYAALANNPLLLTAEDGATVSAAIVTVWAIAWSFRALYRVLTIDGEPSQD